MYEVKQYGYVLIYDKYLICHYTAHGEMKSFQAETAVLNTVYIHTHTLTVITIYAYTRFHIVEVNWKSLKVQKKKKICPTKTTT